MSAINFRFLLDTPVPYHCEKALRFGYPESTCDRCGEKFSTGTITAIVFTLMGREIPSPKENAELAAQIIAERTILEAMAK